LFDAGPAAVGFHVLEHRRDRHAKTPGKSHKAALRLVDFYRLLADFEFAEN
jgi:hypothetical protein